MSQNTAHLIRSEILNRRNRATYTDERLREAVSAAVQLVPFYKQHWKDTPSVSFRSFTREQLPTLPFISRNDVAHHMLDLCADDLARRQIFKHHTSGTTGEPIITIMDEHDWHMNLVSLALQIESLGFDVLNDIFGPWGFLHLTVYPNGATVEIETPLPQNPTWRRLNIPPTSGQEAKMAALELLRTVLDRESTVLNGLPSVLLRVGSYLRRHKVRIGIPVLIITSGEHLSQEVRQQLEDLFESPTFACYGVGEVGNVGFECGQRAGFHLESHRLHVEILGGKESHGEIVVTNIENDAMPLIRYRTSDLARPIVDSCPCGDPRPRIGPIMGRSIDGYIDFVNNALSRD